MMSGASVGMRAQSIGPELLAGGWSMMSGASVGMRAQSMGPELLRAAKAAVSSSVLQPSACCSVWPCCAKADPGAPWACSPSQCSCTHLSRRRAFEDGRLLELMLPRTPAREGPM